MFRKRWVLTLTARTSKMQGVLGVYWTRKGALKAADRVRAGYGPEKSDKYIFNIEKL